MIVLHIMRDKLRYLNGAMEHLKRYENYKDTDIVMTNLLSAGPVKCLPSVGGISKSAAGFRGTPAEPTSRRRRLCAGGKSAFVRK